MQDELLKIPEAKLHDENIEKASTRYCRHMLEAILFRHARQCQVVSVTYTLSNGSKYTANITESLHWTAFELINKGETHETIPNPRQRKKYTRRKTVTSCT